ncbi:MAG: hypothetical protein KDJ97_17640 [Anaerolineae bacterium]|nr:hypothetical protein [Anaerolineae bacterium]
MVEPKFRSVFLEDIFKAKLGYRPWIMFAPSHLANGFFRAVAETGYYNNDALFWAVYAKGDPVRGPKPGKTDSKFDKFSETQRGALQKLSEHKQWQSLLANTFGADKTVFTGPGQSSYSLSHAYHTTSDNHDREVGQWLCAILKKGTARPAYDLLHQLLTQPLDTSTDELTVLSLPLIDENANPKQKTVDIWPPSCLEWHPIHGFTDEIVQVIRNAFDQLAQNDRYTALHNGKLDTLRRMTTLGCFAFYLHLINIGTELTYLDSEKRVPIFIQLHASPNLNRASQATFQWVARSIELFLRQEIRNILEQQPDLWTSSDAVEQYINQTINWFKTNNHEREQAKVDRYKQDCFNFFQSYLGTADDVSLTEALANALTDMIGFVFSAKPYDVARNLGVKIGLLDRYGRQKSKAYTMHPDLLEVLVRSTVDTGEVCTIRELAERWEKYFGILFGGLSTENDRLEKWGIPPVDRHDLTMNAQALAVQLEQSGYAQRYADGVVLVQVKQ